MSEGKDVYHQFGIAQSEAEQRALDGQLFLPPKIPGFGMFTIGHVLCATDTINCPSLPRMNGSMRRLRRSFSLILVGEVGSLLLFLWIMAFTFLLERIHLSMPM